MVKTYYIYILASEKGGTLYIGVTSDLVRRIYEHRTKMIDGFTKQYSIDKLVFYETTGDVIVAIVREK